MSGGSHCDSHPEFRPQCQACLAVFRDKIEADRAERARSWEADGSNGPEDEAPTLLPTLDLAALSQVRAKSRAFAIERIAPLGEVTMLFGPGSAGKSLLGQQLSTTAAGALGLCLGLAVIETPALYLTCEDDTEELHWRQERLCNALDLPMADLAGKLHLVSLRGELGNELATFTSDGKMIVTEAFTRLSHTIRTIGAKIVVLDNVAHLFTGNENDRADVTRFVNVLNRLAGETGAAIILLGHPNKAGDEWSGSTAWNNAVRSRLYLEHDEETDVRKLTLPKANYSLKGQVVSFRWHDWAFVRDEDLPPDTRAELAGVAKHNGENAAFLRCLEAATARKRSVSHNPGSNYAPKVFAAMPESKGHSAKALAGAMERLLHLGTIALDQPLWRGPNRVMKQGIKLAEKCTHPPAQTPCTDPHETPGNPARFNPPISIDIDGAALEAAAPDLEKGEA